MVQGKLAVIIGSSRGIGETTAKMLAKNGAKVCLMGRTQKDLERVAQEINQYSEADYMVVDIRKPESIKDAFIKYKNSGRKIDILVNNSGIYRENSDTHESFDGNIKINHEVVYNIINTNMLGYWWSTLCAKDLMNDDGSIIHISSVNGITGKGGSDIYDMTKAGINNLTLNHARQFAARKIRVNAICPSSTITPMRDFALQRYLKDASREDFDKQEANTLPFKRLGKEKDIANTVLFLASANSSYMTGQIISVDGGFLLKPTFFMEHDQ